MRLEWIFLAQLLTGLLMLFFLRKLMEIKREMDRITKEVTNYVSYITEDTNEIMKIEEKKEKEEAQNRLIQAVLGEYFP